MINALNVWGDRILEVAWPMLWQSSVLIALLFVLDLAVLRKTRAAVRYGVWMLVLIKLVLPPSLALPTSPGWWLRVRAAPFQAKPELIVRHNPDITVRPPANQLSTTRLLPPAPKPKLFHTAWAVLTVATVSLGLLIWTVWHWTQIIRRKKRASAAPLSLDEISIVTRLQAKLPYGVRIKIIDEALSPALYGLFRPIIIIPRTLLTQLSSGQLQTVLLHELFHLKRRDVWVNLAQTLLQIVYWWHPLLWLANARIRRLREEAVDDCVMVSLREDAETYAPTLLEVARLTLQRPFASLGLLGIVEAKRSLRRRIEHLVNFIEPRHSGLSVLSFSGILAFSVVAVPMGQAPEPARSAPALLVARYTAGTVEHALNNVSAVGEEEASKTNALESRQEKETSISKSGSVQIYNTGVPKVQLGPPGGRLLLAAKLNHIRLDKGWDGLPLSEVIKDLADESKKRDPEKKGIHFVINPNADVSTLAAPLAVDPTTGLPASPYEPPVDVGATFIKLNTLIDVRLADLLNAIVEVADRPIKYSVEDYAVVFSPRHRIGEPLVVRRFQFDPVTVSENLRTAFDQLKLNEILSSKEETGPGPLGPEQMLSSLYEYFAQLGVDLTPPKSVFAKPQLGMLMVRATAHDLDIIEHTLQQLNVAPPQVNVKVKFVEVGDDALTQLLTDFRSAGTVITTNQAPKDLVQGTIPKEIASLNTFESASNSVERVVTTVLPDPQFRVLLRALEQKDGTDLLNESSVTTLSGRQTEIQIVDATNVVTAPDWTPQTPATTTNLYQTRKVVVGPVLDITPVAEGEFTIELRLVGTQTEFLGYDDPKKLFPNALALLPLPHFRFRQVTASTQVPDGETIMLMAVSEEPDIKRIKKSVPVLGDIPLLGPLFRSESKVKNKKHLLIFVTPTLIDPAGNRIHAEHRAGNK